MFCGPVRCDSGRRGCGLRRLVLGGWGARAVRCLLDCGGSRRQVPRRLAGRVAGFGHFHRDLRAALLQFDLLRFAQSGRFDHAADLPAVFHRAEHRARPAVHPCGPARGRRRGGCHRAGAGGERALVPDLRLRQISGAPPLQTGFSRGGLRVCAAPESGTADGASVFGAGNRHHRDAARARRLRHRAGRHHGGRKPRRRTASAPPTSSTTS